uniref:Ig-like domain-containing protein n=1 Tax=Astyanax mexicanus TaxID=7994 RepID=A0A3B1JPD3_ASTMX
MYGCHSVDQIKNGAINAFYKVSHRSTHSLQYFYTAVTQGINFPEFTAVGQVDGGQFMYYNSKERNAVPKTDWIQKIDGDDAEYWNSQAKILQGSQETFKVNVQTAMQRFNHTKGVHTIQYMYGCELDDDGTKRGYMQFGYDGEDFLILDLNTGTWVAPISQAVITMQKWERVGDARMRKAYLENVCIEWLQKYVGYGRSVLERKVRPEVSLFQKNSSSPVVCHATGFFPKAVMISWQKNGEELYEDVEPRDTLPNQDGTFQKRSILTLSPEELKNSDKYTCVVQHSSLEKELVLKVSDCRALSGVSGGVSVGVIVGVVVAVLLPVIIDCVGVFIWKKKSGK